MIFVCLCFGLLIVLFNDFKSIPHPISIPKVETTFFIFLSNTLGKVFLKIKLLKRINGVDA
jgi:hypothetical protein